MKAFHFSLSLLLAVAMGGAVLLLGAVVLAGWHAHIPAIIQLSPTLVPMQYNTALCFLLSGMGLISSSLGKQRLALGCGLIVGLLGGLTGVQYLLGVDLGLDQLLMRHYITVLTSHPGRMAPNTALCFVLSSFGLALAAQRSRIPRWGAVVLLGTLIATLGLVAVIGYLIRLETTYHWFRYTHMALHTAIGFVWIGFGLLMLAWYHTATRVGMMPGWVVWAAGLFGTVLTVVLWGSNKLLDYGEKAFTLPLHPIDWLIVGLGGGMTVAMMASLKMAHGSRLAEYAARQSKESAIRAQFLSDQALELAKAGHWYMDFGETGTHYLSSERTVAIFGDPPRDSLRYHIMDEWYVNIAAVDKAVADATIANYLAARDGKLPRYDMVYPYKRPSDGRVVWIHALGHVMRDEQGRATHMHGVVMDITDSKLVENAIREAKEAAEAATRAKGDFLAAMSHEIRTPMNVVLGMSEVLLETSLDSQQHRIVQTMHRSGNALLGLINDILDFSHIESGRFTLYEEAFSLFQLMEETTHLMQMAAAEKGLRLLAEVVPGTPDMVLGDEGRLRQILINLQGNAIKFTHQGEVSVRLSLHPEEAETLLFSVTDSGIGIAPEHIGHIFEQFTQADSGIARRYGGTGLGLAICWKLLDLMGGKIWVQSQLGQGSTFFFTLPCRPVKAKNRSTELLEPVASATAKTLRILIAEDSVDNQLLFQVYLAKTPHHLVIVNDGVEAVAHVQKERFDLLLTDIEMPNMDGYSATRAIRQWEAEEGIGPMTIMALSAHAGIEKKQESLDAGCDGHLTKPIRKQTLLDAIQRVALSGNPTAHSGQRHGVMN
ncbi:MAG: response regulator [Magnetococcales bacterium]|nr:response regulator [Magnetococcales bacterium]